MKKNRCKNCPVDKKEPCNGDRFKWFCEWAEDEKDELHETKLTHIVNRNRIANERGIAHHKEGESKTTFRQVAAGFADTMAHFVASGFKLSGEEKATARLEICQACPELDENARCKICRCNMPAKTKIDSARCPIAKW